MAIMQYAGSELSITRAIQKAPSEFIPAYRWFMEHEGFVGPRPYGNNALAGIDVKLAAQRGIHKPASHQYALSVTSKGIQIYEADSMHYLDDGTWIFCYCAHKHNRGDDRTSPIWNESLCACLRRGLPVGVFTQEKKAQYRCHGLAFVERHNTSTGMFWLHGPVRSDPGSCPLSPISSEEQYSLMEELGDRPEADIDLSSLSEVDSTLDLMDEADEREVALAYQVRRKQQAKFRKNLIEAYSGKCAMSHFDYAPALQAAHITSYLGPKSQFPSNGILLRADIHLLFDSYLLSVDPASMKIRISSALENTRYSDLADRPLALPAEKALRPNGARLQAHFSSFEQSEILRANPREAIIP